MARRRAGSEPSPETVALLTRITELTERIAELESLRSRTSEDHLSNIEKQRDYNRDIYTTLLKINETEGVSAKEISDAKMDYLKSEIALIRKNAKERGAITDEELQKLRTFNQELKKEEEQLEKINKLEKDRKNLQEELVKNLKKSYDHTVATHSESLGLGKSLSTISEHASKIAISIGQFGLKEFGLNVLSAILDGFTAIYDKVKKVAETLEKARVAFTSATGQLRNVADEFNGSLDRYGIGIDKLTKANEALFADMSSFSRQNADVQKQLITTTARMGNLQVSGSAIGKNFNEMTKSLRMNTTQVIALNEKMAATAIASGIAPKKMLEEFSSVMPQLAAQGAKAVEIYMKMQQQAKALGMSVSELNSIVGDQFDTFEGSARAAGKLNAILGGNFLNSVEMLNASEEDRVMLLKQAFEQSGMSYEALGKYERKAIASVLAGGDVNKTNKLFGVTTAEVNKEMKDANDAMDDKLQSQKKGDRANLDSMTIMEKLNKAIENSTTRVEKQTVAEEAFSNTAKIMNATLDIEAAKMREMTKATAGLVDKANEGFDAMRKFAESFPGILTTALTLLGPLIAGISAIRNLKLGGRTPEAPSGGAPEGLGGAEVPERVTESVERGSESAEKSSKFVTFMESLRDGIQAWAKNPKDTFIGLGMLAISILSMVGIYILISKLMTYANNIPLEKAVQAAAVLAIFGGSAILLDKIGSKLGGGYLEAALAMGVIGLGILGFAKAFEILKNVNYESVAKGMLAIGLIVGGVMLAGLAFANPFSQLGAWALIAIIAGLGAALLVMGSALIAIGTGSEKLGIFLNVIKSMSASDWTAAEKLNNLDFNNLGKSLQGIPSAKVWEFKALIDSLLNLKSLGAELPTLMTNLVTQIAKIGDPLAKLSGPIDIFHTLALYLREVNEELNKIPTANIEKIKTIADSIDKTKNVTAEQLKPSIDFMKSAKEYFAEQSKSKDASQDALIQAIKTLTSQKDQQGRVPIQLIVEGEPLANALSGKGNKSLVAYITGLTGLSS